MSEPGPRDLYNALVTAGAGIDQASQSQRLIEKLLDRLDAQQALLLTVARWMHRLEGGAFDGMKGELPETERATVTQQFSKLQEMIDKAAVR